MTPNAYCDIEIRGAAGGGPGAMPALPVMARLVKVLHGIFADRPGQYALALPAMRTGEHRHPGHVARVFAENRDLLHDVQDALQRNERIHGYVLYGRPAEVPPDYAGPWIEYRHYRIPGTRSRLEKCRDYRLRHGDTLPYLRIASKNTGQAFSLYVEALPGTPSAGGEPDGYGLSVPTRRFCLPDIRG